VRAADLQIPAGGRSTAQPHATAKCQSSNLGEFVDHLLQYFFSVSCDTNGLAYECRSRGALQGTQMTHVKSPQYKHFKNGFAVMDHITKKQAKSRSYGDKLWEEGSIQRILRVVYQRN